MEYCAGLCVFLLTFVLAPSDVTSAVKDFAYAGDFCHAHPPGLRPLTHFPCWPAVQRGNDCLLLPRLTSLTPGIYRWKASREMLRPGSFIPYQDVPTLLPLEALVSTELNLIFSLGDKKWWQLITSAQNKQVLRKGPNHTLKYRYIHLHLRTGSWTGRNLNTWLNDSTSEDCSAPNQGMCNFVPLFKWCKTF